MTVDVSQSARDVRADEVRLERRLTFVPLPLADHYFDRSRRIG